MHDPRGLNSFKTIINSSLSRWKRVVVVVWCLFSRSSLKNAALLCWVSCLWSPSYFLGRVRLAPPYTHVKISRALRWFAVWSVFLDCRYCQTFRKVRSRFASRSVIARTTLSATSYEAGFWKIRSNWSAVTDHQRFVNKQTTRLINKRTTYCLRTNHVWSTNTPPCCLHTHQVLSKTNHATTIYKQTNKSNAVQKPRLINKIKFCLHTIHVFSSNKPRFVKVI